MQLWEYLHTDKKRLSKKGPPDNKKNHTFDQSNGSGIKSIILSDIVHF